LSKFYRINGGHRRSVRQNATFVELLREYPQLQRPRKRAVVPDPWDVEAPLDSGKSWKANRSTQYRSEPESREPIERPRVTYDSPWYWHTGFAGFRRRGFHRQLRVRLKFRRFRISS
jgi:hypothetical protein